LIMDSKFHILGSITVAAQTDQLNVIREFIAVCAADCKFDEQQINFIELAVDEICANIARHAKERQATKEIIVSVSIEESQFVVTIEDNAMPFNPLNVPSPNMVDYFRAYKSGGLGIHIVRTVMDNIIYTPSPTHIGYNALTLRKQLPL
jgi:serine/threonine-protein kinase RsbW